MPLEHRSISNSARSLSEVVRLVTGGDLLVDTPYQRGDVWTQDQRRNLIKSLIMGVPIPSIVLNARHLVRQWRETDPDANIGWACIDGKQRLSALTAWLEGKLAIPAAWLGEDFVGEIADGDEDVLVYFHGLTPAGQRFMSRWTIPLAEATLPTLDDEIDVYNLINRAGTPHTPAELDKAEQARTRPVYLVVSGAFKGDFVHVLTEPEQMYATDRCKRVHVARADGKTFTPLVDDLKRVNADAAAAVNVG